MTTGASFYAVRVGVKMDGDIETKVRDMFSFFSFFVGCGANANEAPGVSPRRSFYVLAMIMVSEWRSINVLCFVVEG